MNSGYTCMMCLTGPKSPKIFFLFTGETIVVFLNMSAETLPDVVSRNTVAEIKGYEFPEQVISLFDYCFIGIVDFNFFKVQKQNQKVYTHGIFITAVLDDVHLGCSH